MKKIILTTVGLICSLVMFAQNDTYRYHFNGNLLELWSPHGPALTAQCTTGTYGSESLPGGLNKKTYRFNSGCGLVYNDATKNFLASGTYTIELYYRLDTISGYRKLVDFDSMKKDAGLYNQGGRIVLYPNFTSVDSFIGAGVWQYAAITRDGTSKKMFIYANGKTKGTYTDNTDQYKLGVNKALLFFRDDTTTMGEQSKGAVTLIHISNYVIDSTTIKNSYTGVGHTLGMPDLTGSMNEVIIYPNPTNGEIHITSAVNCSYSICDIAGKTISTGTLRQGDNSIKVDYLSNGLYLLNMVSYNGSSHQVYKFTKQ